MTKLIMALLALPLALAGELSPSCPLREAERALRKVLSESPRPASARVPAAEQGYDEDADDGSFGIDGAEVLPNFGTVMPGVYRSGQFNREGLLKLKELGVKTILDLRSKVSNDERDEAARLGMTVVNVAMSGATSPSYEQVDRALKIVADPALRPVLVHCHYGKDRTGVTIASFRTRHQGWTIPAAVTEAKSFGCCQPLFRDLAAWLKDYLSR